MCACRAACDLERFAGFGVANLEAGKATGLLCAGGVLLGMTSLFIEVIVVCEKDLRGP